MLKRSPQNIITEVFEAIAGKVVHEQLRRSDPMAVDELGGEDTVPGEGINQGGNAGLTSVEDPKALGEKVGRLVSSLQGRSFGGQASGKGGKNPTKPNGNGKSKVVRELAHDGAAGKGKAKKASENIWKGDSWKCSKKTKNVSSPHMGAGQNHANKLWQQSQWQGKWQRGKGSWF